MRDAALTGTVQDGKEGHCEQIKRMRKSGIILVLKRPQEPKAAKWCSGNKETEFQGRSHPSAMSSDAEGPSEMKSEDEMRDTSICGENFSAVLR